MKNEAKKTPPPRFLLRIISFAIIVKFFNLKTAISSPSLFQSYFLGIITIILNQPPSRYVKYFQSRSNFIFFPASLILTLEFKLNGSTMIKFFSG